MSSPSHKSSSASPRFSPAAVHALAARVAGAAGVPPADAETLAAALVAADIQGNKTHGISRLDIYMRRIERGLIASDAPLTIERDARAVLVLDAGNGLGQVQALKALDLLEPRAREFGVAAATVRNSQHFGTLSYYTNRMAERDMILLATTNCEPAMSPSGACQAIFGTNPIGASFPTGQGYPIKIDLATSIVARGNIIAASQQGKAIPEGWALAPDGTPTTDPAAALAGTVLTMAGHKGYALALMVEMLAGVLSGAAVGSAVGSMYKDMDRKQDVGHFFCLLDVAAFMDVAEFRRRADALINDLKSSRRRPGVDEVLVPGERSHRTAAANAGGIELPPSTLESLRKLCADLGVDYDLETSA